MSSSTHSPTVSPPPGRPSPPLHGARCTGHVTRRPIAGQYAGTGQPMGAQHGAECPRGHGPPPPPPPTPLAMCLSSQIMARPCQSDRSPRNTRHGDTRPVQHQCNKNIKQKTKINDHQCQLLPRGGGGGGLAPSRLQCAG